MVDKVENALHLLLWGIQASPGLMLPRLRMTPHEVLEWIKERKSTYPHLFRKLLLTDAGMVDWECQVGAFSLVVNSSSCKQVRHNRSGTVKDLPKCFVCDKSDVGTSLFIKVNWYESMAYLLNEEDGSSQVLSKKLFKDECLVIGLTIAA